MVTKRVHKPLLWIPSLSVAEEIPTTVITFVALLMFLQFGESMAMSALYSSLLFLPFVLRAFMRSKVRSAGFFKKNLHIAEGFIFLFLLLLELVIHYYPGKVWGLFAVLFAISSLCAWHDLLGSMYYDRMLFPRQQKVYNKTKIFASQSTQILTYGVLIIFVGVLEVIFRMPTEIQTKRLAWAMECYVISGAFLLFFLLNIILLKNPRIHNPYRYESMRRTVTKEVQVIEQIRHKQGTLAVVVSLFLLLLPQALMFYTRVFFLLGRAEDGGLDCSIQELGFAQGTIGVIAFGSGILLGRWLLSKFYIHRLFWPMSILLTLSPLFYMLMAHNPQIDNLLAICSMCLLAQFCFGFGLNICIPFIHFVSGKRYRNTIGYIYIPLVAGCMLLPMALSGFVCQWLGYKLFFIIDASFAVVAWIALLVMSIRNKLENDEHKN